MPVAAIPKFVEITHSCPKNQPIPDMPDLPTPQTRVACLSFEKAKLLVINEK
jgi:hypothetical protein